MLAVACVGMMVYGLAGAAPNDGRELAAAPTTSTTAKGDKGSTTDATGKGSCGGKDSTSTTTKDGGGKDSTSTTTKDGGGKDSTSTTSQGDSNHSSDSTPTTSKNDPTMATQAVGSGDLPTTAEVKSGGSDKGGSTTATTGKSDSGSSGKDNCDPTTPTTDNGGKDTTDTTRKGGGKTGGKDTTTTTTGRKDRPTTSTTDKQGTVDPSTPGSGGDPGSGGTDTGGSSDPTSTPIQPQEAPPENPAPSGPDATDPGPGGDYYAMPDEGPVPWDGDQVAISPMAAPGEAAPVIPFGDGFYDGSGRKPATPASRPARSSGRSQQAAPPLVMSSSGVVQASSGGTESAAVSRNLAGLQTSASESAFPASIISTPKVFPINRRDPLAAAALILLVGVARELFKAWRRQANDYWVA